MRVFIIAAVCVLLLCTCSEKKISETIKNSSEQVVTDSTDFFDTTTFYDNSSKFKVHQSLSGENDIIKIMYEVITKIQSKEFAAEFNKRGKNSNILLDSIASDIVLRNGFESVKQYESLYNDCIKSQEFKLKTDSLKSIINSSIYKLKYSRNK